MKLKLLLAAALAFVMVSCGATGIDSAAKKKTAATSFGAISAFGPSIATAVNTASKSMRPQATTTDPLSCSGGGQTGTISFTDSPTSASITLTSTGGCTNGDTTIRTGASGFSLSFTGSGALDTNFTLTMTFNGSVTITADGATQTFVYNNFAITITSTGGGESGSVRLTGSVSVDGQTQTFNDTYSFSELN